MQKLRAQACPMVKGCGGGAVEEPSCRGECRRRGTAEWQAENNAE